MALADYQPKRVVVEIRKGLDFNVRGLSFEDISTLMGNFAVDLDKLIDIYAKVGDTEDMSEMAQYTVALVREAPLLVAQMIALASDEPDSVEQARTLTMVTQINAIRAIGKLTFEEAGGPKKFFESLTELVKTITPRRNQTGSRT